MECLSLETIRCVFSKVIFLLMCAFLGCRYQLEEMLKLVHCEIIDSVSNEEIDSYVLRYHLHSYISLVLQSLKHGMKFSLPFY